MTRKGPARRPLSERLSAKVEVQENGCWRWTGAHDGRHGYGHISRGGRGNGYIAAHRAAYEIHRGPIPEGAVIDHLCRNPWCVNPAHLEAVTNRENVLRGVAPNVKLHRARLCKRGYPQPEAKTEWKNYRGCHVCARELKRERAQCNGATSMSEIVGQSRTLAYRVMALRAAGRTWA